MNLMVRALRKRKIGVGLLTTVITISLFLGGPSPALAFSGPGTATAIAAGIFSTVGAAAIGYGIYENLPSRQGQERLLKGEFYVGGYAGASLVPHQDLDFSGGVGLNGFPATKALAVTARNNRFDPSVTGGLKLGYFCNYVPYLGLEVETNVARNNVRNQTCQLSRPLQGYAVGNFHHDTWVNWTMALHLVARYGFLRDKEVPFGRLQPYVGIGPGFVVMYDEVDAAKNFAIDVMGGVRYMLLKNVSAFLEYKYSHQFDAEMESHYFSLPDNTVVRGTAHLPYDSHKIVLGVSFHW